jgi:DNA-binding response regulator phoP
VNTIYDAKILIVDDNADLLALLCEQLRGAGYGKIRTAQSCGGARAAFAAGQPELMILDINLPDGDGFSLFRVLRAKADVPALFLSARDADADRLFGLGLGADDYLTKPFLMQELLLRVQHILQRAYRAELSAAKPTVLQLGPRSVDLNDAVVSLPDGKNIGADGYRAGPAAQAGRKPGAYRDL